MAHKLKFVAITCASLLAASGLSACTSTGGGGSPRAAVPAASVEGNWRHGGGLFNATFAGGRFDSISPQSGDRLAAGSYSVSRSIGGGQLIELDFATSRGTREKAACKLTSPDIISCQPSNGSSFTMYRLNEADTTA